MAGKPRPAPPSCYQTALRLLTGRELSRAQLVSRLRRREYAAEEIDETVRRLEDAGLLSSRRAALAAARRAYRKGYGPRRALKEIEQIDIPAAVARSAVDEVYGGPDGESALLQRVLERRYGDRQLGDPAARRRLHAVLLRRGFDPALVYALLRRRVE